MTSLNCAQKMFAQVPKYLVTRNLNRISSRTIKIPARYELLKQAASDRLLLNWFSNAWDKTKNTILDNWESAGLIKKRKPSTEGRKSATTTIRKGFRSSKTDTTVSQNASKELAEKELLDKGSKVTSSVDELSKAKNKFQRQLAENWDAIKQANSKANQNLVDDVKKSATSTIDEVSKSVKEQGISCAHAIANKGELRVF